MSRSQWQLPPTARSVPEARRHIAVTLQGWGLDTLVDTARLLTSELVTNAVLHARTDMTLTVETEGDGVRVSVTDASPISPAMRRHSDTATTGRGLRLLDELADSWTVSDTAGGKTVSFSLSGGTDPWHRAADRLAGCDA